jgi:acyl carrier protein
MNSLTMSAARLEELRVIVADVLEREPDEVSDAGDFQREYDADSMRAIEILSRIEKKYRVEIPQSELPAMQNLAAVYAIVGRYASWPE